MTSPLHITAATLIAVTVLVAAAAPAAAEDGRIKVGLSQAIHYRHLDFNRPQDRLALLVQVESAAEEYCDRPMVRSDREKCARMAADRALKGAPETVRRALTLARAERDGVKQAKR